MLQVPTLDSRRPDSGQEHQRNQHDRREDEQALQ